MSELHEETVEFQYPDDPIMDDEDATKAKAAEALRRLMDWAWQAPLQDIEGLVCRTVVLAWIFSPPLRSYTMTEIAGRVGKKKQSIGRAVDSFKSTFPDMAKHLRHLRK